MSDPSRPLLVWLSVGTALLMLAVGMVLIQKNTPRAVAGRVNASPPEAPASSRTSELVAGVGIVEPSGELVSIGTQLAGVISDVPVTVGQLVEGGTPLIELDSRAARSKVDVSRAEVRVQQTRLKELEGEVESRRAKLAAASAAVRQAAASREFAAQELKRVEALRVKGAATTAEIDLHTLNLKTEETRQETALSNEREARVSLRLLAGEDEAPSMDLQRALIAAAEAAVRRDEVQLELHTIRAPGRCRVLQIRCHPGEYLPTTLSAEAPLIVGVTEPLHIRVAIDEADIPRFSETGQAYAVVRGRAARKVPLTFVRRESLVVPKTNLAGGQRERIDTRVLEVIFAVQEKDLGATVGQLVDVYLSAGDSH
jgi:HlyD family secretion protein